MYRRETTGRHSYRLWLYLEWENDMVCKWEWEESCRRLVWMTRERCVVVVRREERGACKCTNDRDVWGLMFYNSRFEGWVDPGNDAEHVMGGEMGSGASTRGERKIWSRLRYNSSLTKEVMENFLLGTSLSSVSYRRKAIVPWVRLISEYDWN